MDLLDDLDSVHRDRKWALVWLLMLVVVTFALFAVAIWLAAYVMEWEDTSIGTAITTAGGLCLLSMFIVLLLSGIAERSQRMIGAIMFIIIEILVGGYIINYSYEVGGIAQGIMYFILTVALSLVIAWVLVMSYLRTRWMARRSSVGSYGIREAEMYGSAPGGVDKE